MKEELMSQISISQGTNHSLGNQQGCPEWCVGSPHRSHFHGPACSILQDTAHHSFSKGLHPDTSPSSGSKGQSPQRPLHIYLCLSLCSAVLHMQLLCLFGPYWWLTLGCGNGDDVLEGEMDRKWEHSNHCTLPFRLPSQGPDMHLGAFHLLSLHSSARTLVLLSTDLMRNPTRAWQASGIGPSFILDLNRGLCVPQTL